MSGSKPGSDYVVFNRYLKYEPPFIFRRGPPLIRPKKELSKNEPRLIFALCATSFVISFFLKMHPPDARRIEEGNG
jgi:hypothetical protein